MYCNEPNFIDILFFCGSVLSGPVHFAPLWVGSSYFVSTAGKLRKEHLMGNRDMMANDGEPFET